MESWLVVGFAAGLVIAAVTSPVGVSGAVFLLPVQLSVLAVPSPAITPTNLLFNVVSVPGAVVRYLRRGQVDRALTGALVAGTLPGVLAGSVLRVFVVPGPVVFRLLLGAFLVPLGVRLCLRSSGRRRRRDSPPGRVVLVVLGSLAGAIGGVYGIGGGSLLGPLLVGRGLPVSRVAPAALMTTLLTSVVGAGAYTVISVLVPGTGAEPEWALGLVCGLGGSIGGYLGARVQRSVSESALRVVLGVLAGALGLAYVIDALTG
ncbi:TSUP family transporter [Actinomycetospora atypica]|uniref:Probable membrane transporter protein n=1 Tax=Actinomycetospora atypica TaxID=1290095 RepID=A0ABV9YGB0_9PSEU